MSGRRGRVARKAARAELTQLDRDFNAGIAALKKDRDEILRKANADYEKSLATLKDDRTKARAEAEALFEQGRAELLRVLTQPIGEAA